ncbi:MAG TPA: hypothetical protein VL357_11465 [Rariglobus sp.]|jgi:hypothetical protein|nr:hypothetical protein [Rariglobus sp.]
MKPIRFVLIGVVVVTVLLAVVIALAFTPGIQTWAARKAIAGQPGLDLKIGGVNAGLNVTRVENIHLMQPGMELTLPSAEVEVSLVDAARSRAAVKRVEAKGWTLDLSLPVATATTTTASSLAPAKNATASSPVPPAETVRQAFAGIFQQLQLPVDFSLDGIDIEGDVILPAKQGTVHVVITGGNLAAGQDGKITIKATLTSGKKDAPVSKLVLQSDITVRMDTPRSFDHLAVVTNATATGEQFPDGAAVHVTLDAARAAEGAEAYSLVFQAGKKELVNLAVKLPAGTKPFTGTWAVDVHDTDLAPFAMGRTLPAFIMTGKGSFIAYRTAAEIHTVGQLNATVDRLSVLAPEFSAIGRVVFETDFDVTKQEDTIRIDRFSSQISGAKPVLSVSAKQVLKFNTATRVLEAERPADDLFGISLQGLPLAWAKPFLSGFDITGNDLKGEFAATARDGGFTLRSVSPLILTQLNVAQAGKPLVRALDISVGIGGDYTPKGWQAEVSNLTVASDSGPAPLLTVNARAGQSAGANQPVKATASFEADLYALLRQPVAPAGISLSHGVARGDVTASIDDKQSVALTLQLADLLTGDSRTLPGVALYVRADRDSAGRIDAQAPIVITQAGRKSDLTFGAVVIPGKTGTQIDAQLASDTLYVEDLQRFSGLTQPAPVSAAPETKSPPSKPAGTPAGPLWAGLTGELKLALKKVVYSPAIEVADIGGSVKITPDAVSLDAFRAALGGEATLKAGGSLSYDAKQAAAPYGLKADLAVANFDPAPMLRGLNPSKPAQVEGKFDVSTHLSGRAFDPAGFKDTALGDVTLMSRGGTLRVLSVKTGKTVSNASKAAAVIGFLGALSGNSQAARIGQQSEAAASITQQLGTINFDQLSIVLSRDSERDVLIKDITLISPQMRMAGSGKITFVPDVPIRLQPLQIDLQVGARDQLAASFRQLRLLGAGGADTLGYVPLSEPIHLDGTLQSIGTEQLQRMIVNAITN